MVIDKHGRHFGSSHPDCALFPPTHTTILLSSPYGLFSPGQPRLVVGRGIRALPVHSGDVAFALGCVEVHVRSRSGYRSAFPEDPGRSGTWFVSGRP